MIELDLLYRDSGNYKDSITIKRDTKLYPNLEGAKVGDGFSFEEVGITSNDIPMLVEYGFGEDDIDYVEVERVKVL